MEFCKKCRHKFLNITYQLKWQLVIIAYPEKRNLLWVHNRIQGSLQIKSQHKFWEDLYIGTIWSLDKMVDFNRPWRLRESKTGKCILDIVDFSVPCRNTEWTDYLLNYSYSAGGYASGLEFEKVYGYEVETGNEFQEANTNLFIRMAYLQSEDAVRKIWVCSEDNAYLNSVYIDLYTGEVIYGK